MDDIKFDTVECAPKKKSKGKLALKIIASIAAVIFLFIGVTTIITAAGDASNKKYAASFNQVAFADGEQLTPVKDADGYWTFTTERDFKVVQLTDIHIGGGWMSLSKDKMALNAVAAMLQAEKPDLVIITGDVVYPVPFQAGTFNNKLSTNVFIELMETLGVYWTVAFGNHDTEAYSYLTREDVSKLYTAEGLKHCLYQTNPAGFDNIDGFGNQIIKVKNNSGVTTRAFTIFDSHSYTNGDWSGAKWQYDNIKDSQIDWYKTEINRITAENKAIDASLSVVKSLAFFHIPLAEYRTAYNEYLAAGKADTENTKFIYGVVEESEPYVYCGIGEDNLFETMVELGSTQGIFCGHDHLNNICLEYKGIKLTYGMSIDYLAYLGISKQGKQRGCTVITTKNDGSFSCQQENYYQDKYPSQYPKEKVTDM